LFLPTSTHGSIIDAAIFAELIELNGEECLVTMGLDITDRKRAEEMLRTTQARLEQMVQDRTAELELNYREQEALNYSISHNLRGPLRSLYGFSRILLSDHLSKMNEEGRDCLLRICSAAERMEVLVDAMLQLARINRKELRIEEVDLTRLFKKSIHQRQEEEPDRLIDLQLTESLPARGDPDLLATLIDNLVDNAWKFTRCKEAARIDFSCTQQNGETVFCVKDNGAGFDMAFSHNLYEPFQRLHGQEEFPGIGIGLAIAASIVKRHRGNLWAEAEPNNGAAFYFTLGVEP
jgi:light-regulated signal transduction histidine kinase (bacteriophytochrome)